MVRFKDDGDIIDIDAIYNLHSSMVRFKVEQWENLRKTIYIYIPVWFDLKRFFLGVLDLILAIYIPVWFDLKASSNLF